MRLVGIVARLGRNRFLQLTGGKCGTLAISWRVGKGGRGWQRVAIVVRGSDQRSLGDWSPETRAGYVKVDSQGTT